MCVILDASARDNVFGKERTAAGKQFFDWLETRRALLVIGGKLTDELASSRAFEKWAETAVSDGRVRVFRQSEVDTETRTLSEDWSGKSNDQHVIALARISGARILYANDGSLCDDFKDPTLVSGGRGRIYPVGESQNAAGHRRRLLNRTDLCPNR